MSSTSSPTLICDVRARRTDRWVAGLALVASAVGLSLVTAFDSLVACMLFVICAAAISGGLARAGWIGTRRIVGVTWLSDGRWRLVDRRGVTTEATLRSDSRVGSRWVWLRWDTPDRWNQRSLLLAAGDAPRSDLRRLMMRLRIANFERNADATHLSPP